MITSLDVVLGRKQIFHYYLNGTGYSFSKASCVANCLTKFGLENGGGEEGGGGVKITTFGYKHL